MPERKVPLGVAEADALAEWLDATADYFAFEAIPEDEEDVDDFKAWAQRIASEAREWAEAVRPVKIGGVVMKEGK